MKAAVDRALGPMGPATMNPSPPKASRLSGSGPITRRSGSSRPALMVFADDWGRHASSCQHLIRRLREDFRVLWVNSIGTRRVRADAFTFRRGLEKLTAWQKGLRQVAEQNLASHLTCGNVLSHCWQDAQNFRPYLASRSRNA